MTERALLVALATALLFLGCSKTPPRSDDAPASAPASRPVSAHEALAALDPRRPVPLQPMMAWHQKQNMMAHLEAVQAIIASVPAGDWERIGETARSIGTSPRMQQMCEHMGAGADGFAEAALAFHRSADTIAEAAREKDAHRVLEATAATLSACTGCHATYKQEVVDAPPWSARVAEE